jgi:hypothetical protein
MHQSKLNLRPPLSAIADATPLDALADAAKALMD